MKKLFFTISVLSICGFNAKAQSYIFNGCNSRPLFGDSLIGLTTQYDPTGVTPGNAGANVVWNYSTLVFNTYTFSISRHYLDPAVSDSSGDFPDANLAYLDQDGYYSYYGYGPDSLTFYGDSANPYFNHYYWDVKKVDICPFAFGDTFADFSSYYTPLPICPAHHTYENRVVSYDAYGSLLLPAATYSAVARIKEVEDILDSTLCPPVGANHFINVIYTWYDIATLEPVFHLRYFTDTTNHYSNEFVETYSYSHLPAMDAAGVRSPDEQEVAVTVYPNPSHGKITISNRGTQEFRGALSIYNVLGKEIYHQHVVELSRSENASLSLNIPAGIYFMRINSEDSSLMKKIIVE